MGRNLRKVRTATRTRQMRYRERLRKDGAPTPDAAHRAIRQSFLEEVEAFKGSSSPSPGVSAFIGSVSAGARRRLVAAGYDRDRVVERLRKILLASEDD
jgi:hypothetical protein